MFSGRSVSDEPSRSSKVYISLVTISVSAPDAAGEELRLLENGRADFAVVVGAKNGASRGFHAVPDFGGGGQ